MLKAHNNLVNVPGCDDPLVRKTPSIPYYKLNGAGRSANLGDYLEKRPSGKYLGYTNKPANVNNILEAIDESKP